MLLHRLVEHARSEPGMPPPFYATKTVRWVVELNPDGSLASHRLTDLADTGDRARRNGTPRMVPSVQRSGAGSRPMLAADTVEYALGWSTDEKRATMAEQYQAAFREMVARWHAHSGDAASAALHRFLEDGHAAKLAADEDIKGSQIVVFRSNGTFVHDTDSARQFWAAEASGRKGTTRTGLCLVCGHVGQLLKTIPQQLPMRLVPGASNNAALVSLNKATHGFALQDQLVHTPICMICGLQAMNALEKLLASTSSAALQGQDARLTWWVNDRSEFDFDILDNPDPARIDAMLGSAGRGRPSAADVSMFCAVIVGGNVARVVVREWVEQPLGQTKDNLKVWFDDHYMIDTWSGDTRGIPLTRLATVSGRWVPGRATDQGRYAKFGAPGAHRPDGILRALYAAALLGRPLPSRLLAHVVHRVRTDGRLDTERAALIRLALRRRPGIRNPEAYMPTLNPDLHQPAYLSGRLFAVLEQLQYVAGRARGDEALNVTFTDRYFGRAVTSPAVALVAGRRDARAWLKRLRRDRPRSARYHEKLLDELFDQLARSGGIPHGTVLADQAAFILGYHQQRAALRAKAESTTSNSEGVSA